MKKFLKWTGIVLGSVIILLLIAYTVIYLNLESRLNRQYEIAVPAIDIPTDSATVVLGQHVAAIKGCADCHGAGLRGNVVIDDPALGFFPAPNLTNGKGGLRTRYASYTNEDFVRAIRHGIGKNGKTLQFMPSYEYNSLTKKDLVALIAYLKTRPAVDKELPAIKLGPVGYVLSNFDKFPLVVAEKIDHTKPIKEDIHPAVTTTYGEYLAVGCVGCHRDNFGGGDPLVPGSPKVPNITGAGSLKKWTEAQFIQTLRTGVTPEGKKLNPKFMPWTSTKEYTDTEIKSLYLFLKEKQTS